MEGVILKPPNIQGTWQHEKSIDPFSSWGIGGVFRTLFTPKNRSDLQNFLHHHHQHTPHVPLHYLGYLSNVLVRDGGLNGVTIMLKNLNTLQTHEPHFVHVQAGYSAMKLALKLEKQGYSNLNFLVGIPGSIGGCIAMNAGVHHHCIGTHIEKIGVLKPNGTYSFLSKNDITFDYRHCHLPAHHVITDCVLHLSNTPNASSTSTYLETRKKTQPIQKRSCGSVFKNPPNSFAGSLIEQCGLKGYRIGDACVSTKHANFIVNQNHARACDVEKLIKHIQKIVHEKTEIILETEVKIIGESL